MTNKRISMMIQEEIQRLKALGLTQRKTTQNLGISRKTVRKYWDIDKDANKSSISNHPDWVNGLDWDYIESELQRNTPKKILFEELKNHHQLPHYSNFCRYLQLKFDLKTIASNVTMHIVRVPGHSVEVDYSGDGWPIFNPATGEIVTAQLFVGAMSYSGYIYAEFTWTQNLEDFVDSHNKMFIFLGGVPGFIIPDHCKTAIGKSDRFDDNVNPTYHDMCVHYKIVVDAARVRHPRDKPNVERAVGILQQDFFPRIRNKTFTSLWELNRDLQEYIRGKNQEIIKGKNQSRVDLFATERPFLTPLPSSPYELFYFKKAKVHADCHVQHAHNFYSIPYKYCGKEVVVRYNQKMVFISMSGEVMAVHKALKGHGHYSTDEDHYPVQKITDLHSIILTLKNDANSIGPYSEQLVEKLFTEPRHPLKNLRKVQGIISLSKKFPKEAMEYAAEMSLTYNKLFYSFIKQCAEHFIPKGNLVIFKAPKRLAETICLRGEQR